MVGGRSAYMHVRQVRRKSPERLSVWEQNREVIQAKGAAVRHWLQAALGMQPHEYSLIVVGHQSDDIWFVFLNPKPEDISVVGDRARKVTNMQSDHADVAFVVEAVRRRGDAS